MTRMRLNRHRRTPVGHRHVPIHHILRAFHKIGQSQSELVVVALFP